MPAQLTFNHLRELMTTMYPDTDEGSEHPMTAVGMKKKHWCGSRDNSKAFVSAILFNLQGNRVLKHGSYDYSEWFSSDGEIHGPAFWDHIKAACGNLWLHEVDFNPLDTCQTYWNNKELS